jgi:hypothetical protein
MLLLLWVVVVAAAAVGAAAALVLVLVVVLWSSYIINIFLLLCSIYNGFSGLGVACWPLVPNSWVQTWPKASDFYR